MGIRKYYIHVGNVFKMIKLVLLYNAVSTENLTKEHFVLNSPLTLAEQFIKCF